MAFVTAFRGSRDGFHLPIALHKAGLLAGHITDFAGLPRGGASDLLRTILPALGRRYSPDLPKDKLRSLIRIAIRERFPVSGWEAEVSRIDLHDSIFAENALQLSIEMDADLFLYHPNAFEAFSSQAARNRRKILFQYHPASDYERIILADDSIRSGIDFQFKEYAETLRPERLRRWSAAVELADLVVCPCSVVLESIQQTRNSSNGLEGPPLVIVPYGAELISARADPISSKMVEPGRPFALFVGNGIQRKGIHWLLHAWERLGKMKRDLDLVLVVRKMDPVIKRRYHLGGTGVKVFSNLTRRGLDELMKRAAFLVNPSLLEGFGHVYLEALSQGTPVLGSERSFLADLPPSDDVMLWNPGDPESLCEILVNAAFRFSDRPRDLSGPCKVVEDHTWDRFDEMIAKVASGAVLRRS